MDDSALKRFLEDNRKNVAGIVRQLPQHMDYLRSYCLPRHPRGSLHRHDPHKGADAQISCLM